MSVESFYYGLAAGLESGFEKVAFFGKKEREAKLEADQPIEGLSDEEVTSRAKGLRKKNLKSLLRDAAIGAALGGTGGLLAAKSVGDSKLYGALAGSAVGGTLGADTNLLRRYRRLGLMSRYVGEMKRRERIKKRAQGKS